MVWSSLLLGQQRLPGTAPSATLMPPHECRKVDDKLLYFLQLSEEASWRCYEETLAQLKSSQKGFETLMTEVLDKLQSDEYCSMGNS